MNDRYMSFLIGDMRYAIELLMVKEVIPTPETTPVPRSPDYYMGVMNLRGRVISVVDLAKILKVKQKDDSAEAAVIIIEVGNIEIGVTVDGIESVLNVKAEQMNKVAELDTHIDKKMIRGIIDHNSQLYIALDMSRALNIKTIEETAAAAA